MEKISDFKMKTHKKEPLGFVLRRKLHFFKNWGKTKKMHFQIKAHRVFF